MFILAESNLWEIIGEGAWKDDTKSVKTMVLFIFFLKLM